MSNRGRYTKEQIQRRRDAAARLWQEGYNPTQIREALGVTHASTVINDLDYMIPGREKNRRNKFKKAVPALVDWESAPAPVRGDDQVLRLMRSFIADVKALNFRNTVAHEIIAAESRGDTARISEIARLAHDLDSVSQAMLFIVADSQYREKMATTVAGRDDL